MTVRQVDFSESKQPRMSHIPACGVFCAAFLVAIPTFAQSGVSYNPSQRVRTALEACMKDEVSEGAYCIKKCAEHFRLEATKRPPVCVATSAAAKVPAPQPQWVPPPPPKERKPGA